MSIRSAFPYETTHEDVRIPLPDGTRLYARVWRPLTEEPVPALLEYLPDRLTDWTAPRDAQRHPWYAGHGYASVRVDARGHGNSGGRPGDADDAREQADGAAVVEWLARQPWCTGGVGMFGIARGGRTALQVAALAPRELKAVVAVCSTDDPFDDDVHYTGGSLLAVDLHAGAATALAYTARPPDPRYAGEDWRERWLDRLESVEPPLHTWLAHQTRDDYWRRRSVREDYGAVRAAVLAVGGWHDPYRDAVLRLVEHLPADRVRGIVGPWCHQYPDRGLPPGPAIGFLQETLRWWDHWLKGAGTGVLDEPLLRAWISASHPPATTYEVLPGRWVAEPAWPSPRVAPVAYGLQGEPVRVASPQHTGVDAGRFVPSGNEADLPPDQREEDARSACFEFAVPGPGPVEVLGRPRVTLRLRMDVPYGQVVARLCDVAPDGASTLVTRGVLNLSARTGRDRVVPWAPPGAEEEVSFDLSAVGHAFAPGHRIRLALSSAYWPWVWPRAGSEAGWTLVPGASRLELPVRAPAGTAAGTAAGGEADGTAAGGGADGGVRFEEPEQAPPLGVSVPVTLDEPRPERLVVRDVARGVWRVEVDPRPGGTRFHPDGLEVGEDAQDVYEIQEADPLSARARSDRRIRLHRPEWGWDVRITSRSEVECDAGAFVTQNELMCEEVTPEGTEVVFHRTWERRLPRAAT
ncbi:CocE/NonD family hydrolase [Streptomyces sp. SMC 277]|uniref:CocE/NonD family hydrolase n=1 Tax=Streptomyces antimicrobicus TaxID=2883108 RepID=A0ABS8B7D7_9ACTN|nr:CocE/NonD family hydrolase [Streptomyces antimicrobicus]MCB5180487.1 CocE/NonD family hydrolase [Streptomyces antimicrobicus]